MLNDARAPKDDMATVAAAALHEERVEVPLAPRAATTAAAINGILDVLLGLRRRLPREHGLREGGETGWRTTAGKVEVALGCTAAYEVRFPSPILERPHLVHDG